MKAFFIILSFLPFSLLAQSIYNWHKNGNPDTVKCIILIAKCDTCQCTSVIGYSVREKFVYFGDNMPGGNYDPYWKVIEFLDNKKNPFKSTATIWDSKIKE